MFAAPQGRSGKTIITCGVSAILTRRGLKVKPFKKGPDYIDSSWLQATTGMPCRNLDAFLMPEETLIQHFKRTVYDADVALIEGNMGLYDGIEGDGRGSSAHLARLLKTPIILVINTARMARSVAAMVTGYQNFEPETPVAGVILNNVSGERHKKKLIKAIEDNCKIPVIGTIPRDDSLHIKERHLGLVPFREDTSGSLIIERIARITERHIDMEGLLSIARSAPEEAYIEEEKPIKKQKRVRIGVFFDKAFHFYYPEHLEILENNGAELIYIDSLNDHQLPSIDGLYIGGGFPELYLKELERNRGLMEDIAREIEEGLPVYAECAGLMYLSKGVNKDGTLYRMAGVIPSEIGLKKRPEGHGYVEAEVVKENPFYGTGEKIRGHEFHYSYLKDAKELQMALKITRGRGINGGGDGITYKNMFASYTHIHALSMQSWAETFLLLALNEQHTRKSKKEVFYG